MPQPKKEIIKNLEYPVMSDSSNSLSLPTEKTPLLSGEDKNAAYLDGFDQYETNSNDLADSVSPVDQKSKCQKWTAFIRSLTLEPFMFLAMFSFFVRSVCVTNLVMDKACRSKFNYSDEICSNLSSNETIKVEIETFASTFSLYSNLIAFGPGALVMIFVSSWSDKYGRKAPLILSSIGLMLDDIGVFLNTIFFDAPIEYLLVSVIPSGLTGGFIGMITLTYSIASEMTTTKMRTIKYALIELSFGFGISLGMLAGGQLYKIDPSYVTVFAVCIGGHALCIPWIIFIIAETRGLDVKANWSTKLKDLFTFEKLTEGWKACMKVRDNHGRCQIWLLLGSMCMIIITYESFAHIAYLYTFHIYGWNPTVYSEVNTVFSIVTIVISVIFVPLFIKVFKFGDPMFGLIGTLSIMSKDVLIGLAENHVWVYILGNFVGTLAGMAPLAVRSRMSKLVEGDELGKVFAFLSTCESLVPLLGTAIITKVFNETVDYFPGMAYLMGGAVLLLPAGTFLWLTALKPPNSRPPKTVNET